MFHFVSFPFASPSSDAEKSTPLNSGPVTPISSRYSAASASSFAGTAGAEQQFLRLGGDLAQFLAPGLDRFPPEASHSRGPPGTAPTPRGMDGGSAGAAPPAMA